MADTRAHRITVGEPVTAVRVEVGGVEIARTHRARVLLEGSLPPRYYVPREDVRTDLLVPTDHSTTCPYKGSASYWSVEAGLVREENVVWSYEAPIAGMEAIGGLLCFYDERVAVEEDPQTTA